MGDTIKTTAEAIEGQALPKARAVHTQSRGPSPEQEPLPEGVAATDLDSKSPAEWAYIRLVLYIKNFEEQLDADQEIAMGFTGGDAGVMRIEGMGFYAPDIITFYGNDPSGAKTQQIQHVSQLNVMLRALPKEIDRPEPNRIGFRLATALEEE